MSGTSLLWIAPSLPGSDALHLLSRFRAGRIFLHIAANGRAA